MKQPEKPESEKLFYSSPQIIEHYGLLQEIGVLSHIEALDREVRNYKSLFDGALNIFNRTAIDEILDAAVWQISDRFMPSMMAFLWKPLQNREDIVVKCYKNHKLVDLNFQADCLKTFETFFRAYPRPVSYDFFSREMGKTGNMESVDRINPELAIPILGPFGPYGLALMGKKNQGGEYSQAECEFIQYLMSFVSQAIQNHLYYERTLRDEKTGLYNNCFFLNRLNEESARLKRGDSWASVIMIDVDKFKKFNDTYGHLAGDRVLEGLAITIKQGVRAGDVPSRFGGEEFSVLLPDTGKKQAWIAAERLRVMAASMMIPWEPPLSQVTISLGVFSFNKEMGLLAEDIIHRADEALYLSKEMGRNRTTVWGSGLYDKIQQMQNSELGGLQ